MGSVILRGMTDTSLPRELRWSLRRGMKELDLVLTRWAEDRYADASEEARAAFRTLLDYEDPDLWSWLMGHRPPPSGAVADMINELRRYC